LHQIDVITRKDIAPFQFLSMVVWKKREGDKNLIH